MESHGAVESIVHVVACEYSDESLERYSPEVTGWVLCLSQKQDKEEIDKTQRSRRTSRDPRTQRRDTWLKKRVRDWGDSSCGTNMGT